MTGSHTFGAIQVCCGFPPHNLAPRVRVNFRDSQLADHLKLRLYAANVLQSACDRLAIARVHAKLEIHQAFAARDLQLDKPQ